MLMMDISNKMRRKDLSSAFLPPATAFTSCLSVARTREVSLSKALTLSGIWINGVRSMSATSSFVSLRTLAISGLAALASWRSVGTVVPTFVPSRLTTASTAATFVGFFVSKFSTETLRFDIPSINAAICLFEQILKVFD